MIGVLPLATGTVSPGLLDKARWASRAGSEGWAVEPLLAWPHVRPSVLWSEACVPGVRRLRPPPATWESGTAWAVRAQAARMGSPWGPPTSDRGLPHPSKPRSGSQDSGTSKDGGIASDTGSPDGERTEQVTGALHPKSHRDWVAEFSDQY